jgi:hypothetical protein
LVDMLSHPMAMPTSIAPVAMLPATVWMDNRPELQKRETTLAAVDTGKPAARTALRAAKPGEGVRTLPMHTSSTLDGSICDLLLSALRTWMSSSSVGVSFSPPLRALVRGVRVAHVIT